MDQQISAQTHQQRMMTELHGEAINQAPQGRIREMGIDRDIPEYRGQAVPPPTKAREVKIVPLDKGYLVTVGCQTIAIADTITLIEKLNRYLQDPFTSEHLYNQGKFL